MEKAIVIDLLEKYWRAETTVDEEQVLAAYFRGPGVEPDLQPFADLFAYFDAESRVSPGPDFEARILQAVTADTERVGRSFQWGLTAAAAAVLVVVASLFLFTPLKPTVQPNVATAKAVRQMTDTYDDPEQALAAVRHAVLIASVHLNEGRKQISNR